MLFARIKLDGVLRKCVPSWIFFFFNVWSVAIVSPTVEGLDDLVHKLGLHGALCCLHVALLSIGKGFVGTLLLWLGQDLV